jgi:dTMP kinase
VLSDRYFDSSVAYQGAARQLNVDDVRDISLWAIDHLMPDLTVLLDLPAEEAIKRRSSKGTEPDRLESEQLEFFEKARAEYLSMAVEPRFLVIDATNSVEQIHQQVLGRVNALLSQ